MKFLQSYYTDIGIKRKTNQDSLALLKADTAYGEVLMAVMCDGMGGHQLGELASKTVVKRFEKWFKADFPPILYSGLTNEIINNEWSRVIKECNAVLVNYGKRNGIEMGSTLTVFLFACNRYFAAHVGDSRGYMIGEYIFKQITDDHSLIADEIRRGLLTEENGKNDRRKNVLLECVGITETINIDFYNGILEPNVCYLLCTDGFWKKISDSELIRYLRGSQFKDNKMLRKHIIYLIEQIKSRGENDNISAIGVVPVR